MVKRVFISAVCMMMTSGLGAARAQGTWVTAYYAGWRQSHLNPADIDFDAITHLIHFAAYPRPDGTLDTDINLLTPGNVAAAVNRAHEAGKKILYTVGGQSTRARFQSAMSDKYRDAFICNIMRFMTVNKYDGIDIDMEEMGPGDAWDFARFIKELRVKLNKITPRPLLTAAVLWEPAQFAQLAEEFDQINIMTYNLSGPYPGWVLWHNAPVYDGGQRFPNSDRRLPSVDGLVDSFIAAGVPKHKLGIGLNFNGYVWSGGEVNKPREAWTTPPTIQSFPYYTLAEAYGITEYDYDSPFYHWDSKAQAAFLSVEDPRSADRKFISYDNEVTAQKKAQYVKQKGIGGMFIWELGGGYRRNRSEGKKDLLLQAVKQAAFGSIGSLTERGP